MSTADKGAGPFMPSDHSESSTLISRCAADITPEPVQWLWPGRIAIGKQTLIAGEAGLGKSQIGEAEKLTHKAVALALKGNVACLRLCLDRIVPPRRDRLVNFTLPAMNSAGGATKAMAAITTAVASGEVTPSEAAELSRLVDGYIKILEINEIERRLKVLEEKAARDAQ